MTQTFDPRRHDPGEPILADVIETTDAAETTSTIYTMSVGDTFYGTISSSSDEDWIRVELTAGTTYEIAHDGITLSDPLVRLYDGNGTQIASNDDGGPGLNSLLEFTAGTTGTYYISADAYATRTGSYVLSLTEFTPPPPPGVTGTIEELGTFLMEETDGIQRTYNTSQSNQITVDISGLTAAGQQLARWAMDAWEMVANIDFVVQNDGVQGNEMITVDDEDSGAFAYFPNSGSTSTARGNNTNGVELNVSRAWLTSSGTTIDSYSFQTYIHEFGHALGLHHQGFYNFTPGGPPITYGNSAYFTNDSWQMSVMSYFSQTENTSTNASFAYVAGAMMADIWAIQQFYGAPDQNSATAGDTTYGAGSGLDNYMDKLFDWLSTGATSSTVTGNRVAFTVYDRDGVDTFDFGFSAEAARLDMREAQFSDFGTDIGILGIAQGTVIENAILGSGNDTVTGNGAANRLTTNAGDDSITAGDGADTISGGAGQDTVNAGAGADQVQGGNGRDLVYLNQGDDIFTDTAQNDANGRDTVFGGLGDDTVMGGGGADEFHGGDGDDLLNGGEGDDLIYGGIQFDTINGGAGDDTVIGGDGRDRVFLDAGDDRFVDNDQGGDFGRDTVFGGAGNDTIAGGSGGDEFHGGDGDDLLNGGEGDDLIYGGIQFDTINGGIGDDTIFGGDGRDVINLGSGNDRYVDTNQTGDMGQDIITGGSGADTFVFGPVISVDRITDFEIGLDRLKLSSALVGGRTAGEVVDQMFVTGAGYISFVAGAGQMIHLDHITDATGLAGFIDIV
ncbi:MAG: M10 family metallopeptidase C-terminal domain-containing protein [Pseudomonadota bacterium]